MSQTANEQISHPTTDNESRVALTAFFNLADNLGLSNFEMKHLLGNVAHTSFYNWKKDRNQKIPSDTIDRISYLIGIYKSLLILLPSKKAANEWLKKPNSEFNGNSALDFLMKNSIEGLIDLRRYLDSERGAHD